jgi:hypothetical protein
LVGSTANDQVGSAPVITALSNGNYVVTSGFWDNPTGPVINAGAITFGNGAVGTVGTITDGTTGGNSVVGTVPGGVTNSTFDPVRNRLFVGRVPINTVSVLSFTTTAVADGDLSNGATFDNGVPNALVNAVIPTGRTVTISSVMNVGQVYVQCGGTLVGGAASAYVIGSIRRDFCAAAGSSFLYSIGDANNYSPLSVSNVNGTGNLTATVSDTFLNVFPFLSQTTSLSRYWTLNGSGITADLAFTYTAADVNGTESSYKLFRRSLTVPPVAVTSTVNTLTHTVSATGVSQFSDWTAGTPNAPLGPTAAGVVISGRVLNASGGGVRNARVTFSDINGRSRSIVTNAFGFYEIDDVTAGSTFVTNVSARGLFFAPRLVQVFDSLTDVNFTPQ